MGRSRSPAGRRSSQRPSSSTEERPYGKQSARQRPDKIQPNLERSGKLASELLTRNGVVLKYAEPGDAASPSRSWRLHVFKGDSQIGMHGDRLLLPDCVGVVPLHSKSYYLFGRDPHIADVLIEHESCSKQHCVIQHRRIVRDTGFGVYETLEKPYIIDLDSANGTFINGAEIEAGRYYELKTRDLVRFGASTRDYIFLAGDE